MSTTIDVRELPGRLSEALAIVSSGREVLLTDGVTPRARLIPWAEPGQRVAGLHAGAFQVADGFDAPLPDDFWAARERILGTSPPAREIPAGKTVLDMVEGKWSGTETDAELQDALARMS